MGKVTPVTPGADPNPLSAESFRRAERVMPSGYTHDLVARVKAQVDAAIKQDRLKPTEGMRLIAEYERGLKEQTYLTFEAGPR